MPYFWSDNAAINLQIFRLELILFTVTQMILIRPTGNLFMHTIFNEGKYCCSIFIILWYHCNIYTRISEWVAFRGNHLVLKYFASRFLWWKFLCTSTSHFNVPVYMINTYLNLARGSNLCASPTEKLTRETKLFRGVIQFSWWERILVAHLVLQFCTR